MNSAMGWKASLRSPAMYAAVPGLPSALIGNIITRSGCSHDVLRTRVSQVPTATLIRIRTRMVMRMQAEHWTGRREGVSSPSDARARTRPAPRLRRRPVATLSRAASRGSLRRERLRDLAARISTPVDDSCFARDELVTELPLRPDATFARSPSRSPGRDRCTSPAGRTARRWPPGRRASSPSGRRRSHRADDRERWRRPRG